MDNKSIAPVRATLTLDPKYHVAAVGDDLRVVKTSNGVAIPPDEPLILFRARDRLALEALKAYRAACVADGCNDYHLAGIDNRIAEFARFQILSPDAMKQPGATRGA